MSHAPVRALLSSHHSFTEPSPALRAEVASLPEQLRRALGTLAKAKQRRVNLEAALGPALDSAEASAGEERERWIALLERARVFQDELNTAISEIEAALAEIE
jgi:hypothetical protein